MFWIGKTGKQLRAYPDAQRVAMYLMTAPYSEMTGVFYCPLSYILNDVGELGTQAPSKGHHISPIEGASEVLRYLNESGFCFYDFETEWVFVKEMARWQIGEKLVGKDKRIPGLKKAVQSMPEPMKSMFLERYNEDFSLGFEVKTTSQNDVDKTSPIEGASEVSAEVRKPHRSQEQEQEQEQYIINTNNQSTVSEAKGSSGELDCLIDDEKEIFDSEDVIDCPIKKQVEAAQLDALDVSDEKRPLSVVEMITVAKTFGIKLARNVKTEAIANRKTITMEVFRECVKRWKGTNTTYGYFVSILDNASNDPQSVIPSDAKAQPLSADTISDKQAGFFASQLVKDQSFCSRFGKGFTDYPSLISKVAANLHDPRHFEEYLPFMEKHGFVRSA